MYNVTFRAGPAPAAPAISGPVKEMPVELGPPDDDPPPRLSGRGRILILAGFVLAVGLGIVTREVYAPFLAREAARLDGWDVMAMLPGEALAMAGLTAFAVRHGAFGTPFPRLPAAHGPLDDRVFGRTAVALFSGLAFDALATYVVASRDDARYWQAPRVAGTVERVREVWTLAGTNEAPLWIDVTFPGPNGRPRRALYQVARHPDDMTDIPRDRLWRLLRTGQVPQPMDVSCDTDDPGRNWPAGLWGVQGAERVRVWNLAWTVNVLQLCVFSAFLLRLGVVIGRTGAVPGWYHLLPAVPGLAGVVTFPVLIALELGLGLFNGPA